MTLAGFHFQEDSCPPMPHGACVYMEPKEWHTEEQPATQGHLAARGFGLVMYRPYFKGNPTVAEFVEKVRRWAKPGSIVTVLCEVNLEHEGFVGGPVRYREFFEAVSREIGDEYQLYYCGMSPSGDWMSWYAEIDNLPAKHKPKGITVHAYGSAQEMKDVVWAVMQRFPGVALFISEFNFAAGRKVGDLAAWWREHGQPFLDWCATFPVIIAACWFSYLWPDPDGVPLDTPLNARGTAIEAGIRAWRAAAPTPKPTPREEPRPVTQTISEAGLRFIAGFEGFRPLPYNDPAGHATIGYGHLLHKGPVNGSEPEWARRGISQAEGMALLRQDVSERYAAPLAAALKVAVSQAQFDALGSWIFNVGVGWLRFSDLMKRLNAGNYAAVPGELNRFVYSTRQDGVRVKLAGLVRRRRLEGRLFAEGLYEEKAMKEEKRLVIPHVLQNGAGATRGKGDCGITRVVSLARAFGQNVTVDQVGASVGLPPGYTSAHITNHLIPAAAKLGISLVWHGHTTAEDLVTEIGDRRVVILRVWYPSLQKRRIVYNDWHFVSVTGWERVDGKLYFFYDDPEWLTIADGEDIRIEAAALIQATRYNSNRTTPGQALFLRSHRLPERVA